MRPGWVRVTLMDRRRRERYDLRAPLSFSWRDLSKIRQRHDGVLSNISGGGLFILTLDPPPKGSQVHVRVSIPTVSPGRELIIRATGEVVRLESAVGAEGRTGFATIINHFSVRGRERRNRLDGPEHDRFVR